MSRSSDSPASSRRRLRATVLLGAATLLAGALAVAGRTGEEEAERAAAEPAEALALAEPYRTVAVHPSGAARVDTFVTVLSAGHAVETDDAWLLLDPVARKIHVVADDPSVALRSFGREGDGPGELRRPLRVALSGSTLAVLEAEGDRLVRFALDGTVVGPVSLVRESCPFGPAAGLAPVSDGGFVVLRSCTGMDGATRALVLGVDPDGHVRVVEDRRLQGLRTEPVDPYATPALLELGGTPYLGTLSGGCLLRLAGFRGRKAPRGLCAVRGSGVPLPDPVRADLEALAEKMRAIGGRVAIPERLPPFTGVRTTPAGPVLEVPLPEGRTALDLVEEGGQRIRFLAEAPGATWVGRRHLLLARVLMGGTELVWVRRDG